MKDNKTDSGWSLVFSRPY